MERRIFLAGAAAFLATSAVSARASSVFGHQSMRATEYLDCGVPGSSTCLDEQEANSQRRAALRAYESRLEHEAKKIVAANPRYDRYFVATSATGPKKLLRGGIFDNDTVQYDLKIKILPLPTMRGETADHATCRLFRKTGWGTYIVVSDTASTHHVTTKAQRTYRVRDFSGPCIVMWSAKDIGSVMPRQPGCWPHGSAGCSG